MAANFWVSSHHKNWLRNSDGLVSAARHTVARDSTLLLEDEIARAKVLYCRLVCELAVKAGLRQRVAATACVYFKRFYIRHCFKDHDPRLIAPTALYLAAKVEEHTLPAKAIIAHSVSLYPRNLDHVFPYTLSHIYDYEFKLIAALDFDLIIYHPYRPLVQYCSDAQYTDLLSTAWPILNDSYLTDACLLYPPYLTAIACIFLAGTLADRDMRPWVATLSVSNQDIHDLSQHLAGMYSSQMLAPPVDTAADDVLVKKLHVHFKNRLSGGGGGAGPAGPGSKRPPSGSKRN